MSEANATLEYETGYDYSLPHSKTVDLIGEEFIKKEGGGDTMNTQGLLQLACSAAGQPRPSPNNNGYVGRVTSLPPLTFSSSTIPSISSLGSQVSTTDSDNAVLYCNLDDLSRFIPDNFGFDQMVDGMEPETVSPDSLSRVQVLSMPGMQNSQLPAFVPRSGQHFTNSPSVQIQLKPGGSTMPASMQTTIQTIDTTKLAGQLSVVQELPEVSKLVFQEVKQESPDSIVNILETMKDEQSSLSPLDYTVSSTTECGQPLNLVNNFAKGVKRIVAPVHNLPTQPDAKRMRNVFVIQGHNGQQIIQEVPHSSSQFDQFRCSPSPAGQDLLHAVQSSGMTSSILCIEPPSPPTNNSIKMEPKSKSNSPKLSLQKQVTNQPLPSSKTCNWVFENGQVCGKTFSKSYNLVVHMRMHEDIRPFACTLCDQTFRQKAHLQRHETTHGIQTKNFYRTPSSKKKKKTQETEPVKLSQTLQDRLSMVNGNLRKMNGEDDSEGDEYTQQFEDDEDDLALSNEVGDLTSRRTFTGRKYSDIEQQATSVDSEMDRPDSGPLFSVRGKLKSLSVDTVRDVHSVSPSNSLGHLDEASRDAGLMNIVVSRSDDDDTSTVQDILQTVNSVPTLQQKLESHQYLNCDNLLLRALPSSKPIMSVSAAPNYLPVSTHDQLATSLPHITKLVESTTTTSPHLLPGTSIPISSLFQSPATNNNLTSTSNILFTTLSNPPTLAQKSQLSFIETGVPGSAASNAFSNSINPRQLIVDNIDDHSPEIQAEILNALLADETYGEADHKREGSTDRDSYYSEEVWEEEIFRLSSLPATWWVSRRRKVGTLVGDVTYYSPEGYSFKNRHEIQQFLQNNIVPKDIMSCDLRSPPLPIEQIPIIEENFNNQKMNNSNLTVPSTMPVDTNSIAQALIANLRPEPIESLKDALSLNLNSDSRQLGSPEASLSVTSSSPHSPASSNLSSVNLLPPLSIHS